MNGTLFYRSRTGRIVLILVLIFSWIFSDWPQIFNFPPGIQEAWAATATKTWSFDADTESWTASTPNPNNTTASWQSADGSPANGSLQMRITGKNKTDTGRIWEIADTWENIFGIPANSTVTEVGSGTGNSYNYRVSEYTTGAAGNSGSFAFYDNTPTLVGTFSTAAAFSGLVAWTAKTGAAVSVPAGLQASNNTVRFRITNDLATGNSTSAAVTLRQDQIVLTITYTANSAPNAPSQDSPANSATGVSVTPTFLMTATDPDSDDVSYKTTIYSDVDCSATVSTHDQAVDSTGWSGQDATCTAAPTSCYVSGTQGSFTLQAGDALSNETQYWWKTSAKDPDGSSTFTDSSTCNTFTTEAAAPTLTLTIDAGSTLNFGEVSPGTKVNTTPCTNKCTVRLKIDTDNTSGYNISIGRDRANPATTLASAADTSINISDTGGGINVFDGLGGSCTDGTGPATWVDGSSTGLGFTLWKSDIGKETACWGSGTTETDALNRYAALPASSSLVVFLNTSSNSPNPSYASVGLSIDVANIQQNTTYTGDIVFTATTNP